MKTAFHALLIVFAVFVLVVLFDLARLSFMRWRWNRRMRWLVKDLAWRHWIGLVKTRMESVAPIQHAQNVERIISQDAEWFHDLWMQDFLPIIAVEKWLAEKDVVAR